MALVSLTLAKRHLNVDFNDDDLKIEAYLDAAETIVTEYLDRAVYGNADDSPAGVPPTGDDGTAIEITPAITAAILLLLSDMYHNSGSDTWEADDARLPRAVRALLAPYRIWRVLPEGE